MKYLNLDLDRVSKCRSFPRHITFNAFELSLWYILNYLHQSFKFPIFFKKYIRIPHIYIQLYMKQWRVNKKFLKCALLLAATKPFCWTNLELLWAIIRDISPPMFFGRYMDFLKIFSVLSLERLKMSYHICCYPKYLVWAKCKYF